MAETTGISWCHATFNSWIGCTEVSPACAHCYARTLDERRYSRILDGGTPEKPVSHWGNGAPRHRTEAATWKNPLRWHRKAARARVCRECGHGWQANGETVDWQCARCGGSAERPAFRVFGGSMMDWLDDEVPLEWLGDYLHLIWQTPFLSWMLLTKRPELWRQRMIGVRDMGERGSDVAARWLAGAAPQSVWVGVTAENQEWTDMRVPHLLDIPVSHVNGLRFLSCEPLLGPVDLSADYRPGSGHGGITGGGVQLVIAGGESGGKARPSHPDWFRSLRDQCRESGVAFHFKQWGEWLPFDGEYDVCEDPRYRAGKMDQLFVDDSGGFRVRAKESVERPASKSGAIAMNRVGTVLAGRTLDGVVHDAMPGERGAA